MKWRILHDGEIVAEGEGGEFVAPFEAGLANHDDLVLEWTSTSVEIPMELRPFDRVDAQMIADLFDVPVETLPLEVFGR